MDGTQKEQHICFTKLCGAWSFMALAVVSLCHACKVKDSLGCSPFARVPPRGSEGESAPRVSPELRGRPSSLPFLICAFVFKDCHPLDASLHVLMYPFYRKDTGYTRLGSTPMTSSSLVHLQRPYFQIRSHPQVLGAGTSASSGGMEFHP